MRYGPLFASAAVLVGLAACKGNDSAMNADLAKDLAAAKTSDALALAPHAGLQTVVSPEELSPQGRARMASSSKSTRAVQHHAAHRERVATAPSPVQAPVAGPAVAAATTVSAAPEAPTVTAPPPRPQPVDVSYPSSDPGSASGRSDGDGSGGNSGIGVLGGIIGAIGGAILRGGVVDGDHCDPRSHRGGGILINRRGPILRGNF